MSDILILYHTRTGNTELMADAIADGVRAKGIDAICKRPHDIRPERLQDYDGLIVGSPAYYGLPSAEIINLFNNSIIVHGKLVGKVGGAFASTGNAGGGGETVCLGILQMMLVHGMTILGHPKGGHYGPVSLGKPSDAVLAQCNTTGSAIAQLVLDLRTGRDPQSS